MHPSSMLLAKRILDDLDDSTCLPINIARLAAGYDIDVQIETLPQAIEGIYVPKRAGGVVIINKTLSYKEKRFTLAHELYHHLDYLISPSKGMARFKGVRCNDAESEADEFASLILMPEKAFSKLSSSYGLSTKNLSDMFRVPEREVAKRLRANI